MAITTHFFLGRQQRSGLSESISPLLRAGKPLRSAGPQGGPGAGKSTMMRAIGQAMEKKGEQVEYLYCSGDPSSLDGVHIPRIRTAVVDGTAPHVCRAPIPAAVDRYVNLGQFYDVAAAKAARRDIVHYAQAGSAPISGPTVPWASPADGRQRRRPGSGGTGQRKAAPPYRRHHWTGAPGKGIRRQGRLPLPGQPHLPWARLEV